MIRLLTNLLIDPNQYESIFKPNIKHALQTYKPNEKIIEAGKVYSCFYFIKHGKARVVIDEDANFANIKRGNIHTIVAELNKHEIFGEFSLFDNNSATADIIAVVDTEVIAIDNLTFLNFMKNNPALGYTITCEMLQQLFDRIRSLNKTVSHLVTYSAKQLKIK